MEGPRSSGGWWQRYGRMGVRVAGGARAGGNTTTGEVEEKQRKLGR